MKTHRLWDIFCTVIDNHGDLGVCWRLTRQLLAQGQSVRLWVDDASALAWMAPDAHDLPHLQVRPWADASQDAMSCCGTFTHGHVDAKCLDELFRVLRPGAPFAFTVKLEVWESLGFKGKLAALQHQGQISESAFRLDRHYSTSAAPDGVFCVYRRT